MLKKIKLNGEGVFSLFIMLVGVIWAINGIRLGFWVDAIHSPGSGLFPFIVGIILITLSTLIFIKSLNGLVEEKKMSVRERKTLLVILGAVVLFMISFNLLGTFVTLAIGLFLWFKLIAKYSWIKTIIGTICIAAAIYGIFVVWLSVPFPKFFGIF